MAVITDEDPCDGMFIVFDSDDYVPSIRIQTVVYNVGNGLLEAVSNLPKGIDQLLGVWRKRNVFFQLLCNNFHSASL